jgi:hypothetical protein
MTKISEIKSFKGRIDLDVDLDVIRDRGGILKKIKALIGDLSGDEKRTAMELLRQDLSAKEAESASPDWHADVISNRVANPSSKPKMNLSDSEDAVRKALDRSPNGG